MRVPAFEPLTEEEQKLRLSLEQNVKTAFYRSGLALIELNRLRLYRSTHLSFERGGRCFVSSVPHAVEEFCQDEFGAACEAGKRHAVA